MNGTTWEDNPKEQKGNELVLTFDDGYLDNWVIAHPILEKFKLKATVFVNPEFVQNVPGIRPQMSGDRRIQNIEPEITRLGFLTWDELRAMEKSEVWDIQSHSMTHNFVFKSSQLIDVFAGQEQYYWLAWLRDKGSKPFFLNEDQLQTIPYGLPIFESGRALGERMFLVSETFEKHCIDLFQIQPDRSNLLKELTAVPEQEKGRWETDEERGKRYFYELNESKQILEKELNKNVDFLCWPGGGYNELSLSLAKDVGYKASTIASRDQGQIASNAQKPYKRIKRYGMGSLIRSGNDFKKLPYANYLVDIYRSKAGSLLARGRLKILKTLHGIG